MRELVVGGGHHLFEGLHVLRVGCIEYERQLFAA
jgi:hypothetical protein